MSFSVNTNVSAMVALRHLGATQRMLEQTQLRITTGLRVNGPKDDPSTYAIAQRMRGDIAGMGAVKTALAAGDSTLSVAIMGGKAVADLLTEMKAKVAQANQAGLDTASRNALQNDFTALRDQLSTIVQTAQFNGKNLITSGASNLEVLGSVQGATISVNSRSMDTTSLGIQTASLFSASGAATALTQINSAIDSVASSLASFGSAARRIEIQTDFTSKLVDVMKAGVGNLVDADLAEESANLVALQIKLQLGIQALSIGNSGPGLILKLFER